MISNTLGQLYKVMEIAEENEEESTGRLKWLENNSRSDLRQASTR